MVEPRTLPHNPQAENAVLGGILLRGRDALSEALELITEDDFYQPRTQAVFRAMRMLDDQGEVVDVITLEAQLRRSDELRLIGGIEGLASFDRYATAHNIKAHAKIVHDCARQRSMVVLTRTISDEGMGELEDLDAYLDEAEKGVLGLSATGRRGGPTHVRDGMAPVFGGIVDRQRGDSKITGCPTPYDALDEMTAGLQPSDLIIIAARPSMGKTALALNIAESASVSPARDVAQIVRVAREMFKGDTRRAYDALVEEGGSSITRRWPVLFFSLEMSEDQLIERSLCSLARVDAQKVRTGERLMENGYRALVAAAERMSMHSDLYLDDRPALSITEIRSAARTWASKHCKPLDPNAPNGKQRGMIMVDYLQLAKGSKQVRKGGSRELEISEISQGLKALAKELRVPVVALAQLNRAVDTRADHRPQLSDLRESGALEQDADVIMFVYRDERYLAPDAPEDKRREVENKAEVIVGKQRNGAVGSVHLTFVKKYTRFENPAPEGYY